MTALTEELRQAIARAYRVFPAAHLRPPIGVCNCGVCVSLEDERAMAETPREQLPARLIREFNNSAHGRNDDLLRHFLPRIFELFALGESIDNLDESNGLRGLGPGDAKLPYADYRASWPAEEVQAIDACFGALFRRARGASEAAPEHDGFDLFNTAELIAASGGDLRPLLAEWDADNVRAATLSLAGLAIFVSERVWSRCGRVEGATLGDYWRNVPEMERAFFDWLRDPLRTARFDAAMIDESDDAAFALLAQARGAFGA